MEQQEKANEAQQLKAWIHHSNYDGFFSVCTFPRCSSLPPVPTQGEEPSTHVSMIS